MGQVKHSKPQPVKVFINHSSVDMVFARHVRNLLVQRVNAQVFTTEDLSAGEKWEPKLRNELSSTDVVVALLTPNSVGSSWVLHEIGAAWALGKPIIPVVTRRDVLNNMPVSLEGSPYHRVGRRRNSGKCRQVCGRIRRKPRSSSFTMRKALSRVDSNGSRLSNAHPGNRRVI